MNTLLKAWQQRQQKSLPDCPSFAQILRIAYQEGLRINPSIRSAIRPVDPSYDSRS